MKIAVILVVLALLGIFLYVRNEPAKTSPPIPPTDNMPVVVPVTPDIPDPVTPVVNPVSRPSSPYDEGVTIRRDRILPDGSYLVIAEFNGKPLVMRSGDNVTWY